MAAVSALFPEMEPKAQPQPVTAERALVDAERALVDVQRAIRRELARLGPKATQADIVAGTVFAVARSLISSSIGYTDFARNEAKTIAEGTHKLLIAAIRERDAELEELREQHAQLIKRCEAFEARLALVETRR